MDNRWRFRDILIVLAIMLAVAWCLTGQQSQVSVNPFPPGSGLQLTPAGGPAGASGGTGATGATGTIGALVQESTSYAVTCPDFANNTAFQATAALTFTLPTGCTTGWASFVPASGACPVAFNLSTNSVTVNSQSTLSSLTVCTGTVGYPGYVMTPDSTTDFSLRNTGPQGASGPSGASGPTGATGATGATTPGTCVGTGGGTATLTFTLAGNSPWVCPLTPTTNATSVTVTGGTFPTNGGGSLVFIVSSVTTVYTLATPSNFATGIPVSQTVSGVVTSTFSTTNSGTTWYPVAASNNLSYSQPTISSTPATPGASTYLNCWYTTAGYQCINSSGVQSGLVATTSPAFTGTPTAPTASQNNNSTQLATTAYTDLAVANAVAGVNPAVAVKYATVAAGDSGGLTYANGASGIGATMTGANNTVTTIDGHAFVVGDVGVTRLLIKNDTQSPSGAFNGIYLFTALHTSITGDVFTRALDYDQPSDMNNTGAIPVQNGTANVSTSWLMTAQIVTVGTTPLTFVQFSYNPATIPSATTATTQAPCDNSTKVATTAYTGFNCETVQTGTTYASSGYVEMIWNNGSGALAATLPATTTVTKCIGNYQAKSGAISFVPPSGSTIYYKGSAGTTSSATGLKSVVAAGDFICVVGQVDGVTWEAIGSGLGTWTNN